MMRPAYDLVSDSVLAGFCLGLGIVVMALAFGTTLVDSMTAALGLVLLIVGVAIWAYAFRKASKFS